MQIRLYYVLPYKAKISAQHGIGFILDRFIVYLGLTMPNLQKKRPPIFEIFYIKKCTFFGTEYISTLPHNDRSYLVVCHCLAHKQMAISSRKVCFSHNVSNIMNIKFSLPSKKFSNVTQH